MLHLSLSQQLITSNSYLHYRSLLHNLYSDTFFAIGEATSVQKYLPWILVGHAKGSWNIVPSLLAGWGTTYIICDTTCGKLKYSPHGQCSREIKKLKKGSRKDDQVKNNQETLGWLPKTWVIHLINYCSCYKQIELRRSWNDDIKRDTKHKSVLWVSIGWMGYVLRGN